MNIGNPIELTILEFAEAVRRAARASGLPGAEARLTHHPFPENDPKQRQPDIRKAREILGWQPEIALEQGLRETLAWFVAHRKGA
jgi:dTDP-glucose 4,6-dehydratase